MDPAGAIDLVSRCGAGTPDVADRAARRWQPQAPSDELRHTLIACIDLTTLEATDTATRVRALARRALDPAGDGSAPPVAALCIYPRFVADAAALLSASPVSVAAVAGAFPTGQAVVDIKVSEARRAIADGASELDVVLPFAELLEGDEEGVAAELLALRAAAGAARLKVILETAALPGPAEVRRAALLALACGADMVKTSTGKLGPGATPEAVLAIAEAVRDFAATTGQPRGVKVSGGVRDAATAAGYACLVRDVLGSDAVRPETFRIGASSLLDALIQTH